MTEITTQNLLTQIREIKTENERLHNKLTIMMATKRADEMQYKQEIKKLKDKLMDIPQSISINRCECCCDPDSGMRFFN